MINRILIRSKVIQIAYSYFLTKDKSVMEAEKELFFSFEKSYELYHLLLTLMVELTDTQAARVEAARMKFLATPEEKNPNMRFVNNRFIEQLRNCKDYKEYHEKKPVTWSNDPEFLRDFSERIVKSDLYKEYMEAPEDSYETDCEFWKKALKTLICCDEELIELLEQKSLYWNDDLEIITTFVLKTIKQFSEENGEEQALLPMFKDDDDAEFAKLLFRNTLLHGEEYRNYIENFIRNWEIERVAFMDIVIMMVAMSEFYGFPSIPTRVTLNEYIELAKSYSTSKSGQFVNGVLNAIADNLKKEGALTKE
ncbi:MAG TPA: transcription antitermination factor NusB [Candidatus Barnesiella excrementigallinarum]|nr:transcription antitermination factor NusB [Candidatus Barnesiella excrementigallinarum]